MVFLTNATPDRSASQALRQNYRQTVFGYFHHGRRSFFQFEEEFYQRLFFTKIWSFRMTNRKEELPKIKALAQLAGFA